MKHLITFGSSLVSSPELRAESAVSNERAEDLSSHAKKKSGPA